MLSAISVFCVCWEWERHSSLPVPVRLAPAFGAVPPFGVSSEAVRCGLSLYGFIIGFKCFAAYLSQNTLR